MLDQIRFAPARHDGYHTGSLAEGSILHFPSYSLAISKKLGQMPVLKIVWLVDTGYRREKTFLECEMHNVDTSLFNYSVRGGQFV
jgi:hypothetical protein